MEVVEAVMQGKRLRAKKSVNLGNGRFNKSPLRGSWEFVCREEFCCAVYWTDGMEADWAGQGDDICADDGEDF